jgi:hypothetical protein
MKVKKRLFIVIVCASWLAGGDAQAIVETAGDDLIALYCARGSLFGSAIEMRGIDIVEGRPILTDAATILHLYQIMKDLHEIFASKKLDYWVDGGTLIGAVRHKGLIPWDDDLDIDINLKDEKKFLELKPIFERIGYTVAQTFFGYQIGPTDGSFAKPGDLSHFPWIDVFLMEQKQNKIYYKKIVNAGKPFVWGHRDGDAIFITVAELLPFKEYQFGSLKVKGPQNPVPFLNNLYGNDWMAVGYQTHIHTNVSGFYKVKIKLTAQDRLPAQPIWPLQNRVCLG